MSSPPQSTQSSYLPQNVFLLCSGSLYFYPLILEASNSLANLNWLNKLCPFPNILIFTILFSYEFSFLLAFFLPQTLTGSSLFHLLAHQFQILSVILDFLSWPVSWTGCHLQEPVSHLALLNEVLGQAHALKYCSFNHFQTSLKHYSAEHGI